MMFQFKICPRLVNLSGYIKYKYLSIQQIIKLISKKNKLKWKAKRKELTS